MPHVRVGSGERFRDGRRVPAKEEHRTVHRVRERPAEQQLAARDRFPGEREVLGPEQLAALRVIGGDVMEQQEVHHVPSLTTRRCIEAIESRERPV